MADKPIAEFEVTMTVRNNRLKARRLALGLTQKELAAEVGINVTMYCGFETMRQSPFTKDGYWSAPALRISEFFNESPWELFPDAIQRFTETDSPSTASRQLTAAEIGLIGPGNIMAALPAYEASKEIEEPWDLKTNLERAVKTLTTREEFFTRQYFGLDEAAKSYREIGEYAGLSVERVRQIIAKALRKLRHPSRAKKLAGHLAHYPEPWYLRDEETSAYKPGDQVWVDRNGEHVLGRVIGRVWPPLHDMRNQWVPAEKHRFRVRLVGRGTVDVVRAQMRTADDAPEVLGQED